MLTTTLQKKTSTTRVCFCTVSSGGCCFFLARKPFDANNNDDDVRITVDDDSIFIMLAGDVVSAKYNASCSCLSIKEPQPPTFFIKLPGNVRVILLRIRTSRKVCICKT